MQRNNLTNPPRMTTHCAAYPAPNAPHGSTVVSKRSKAFGIRSRKRDDAPHDRREVIA